MLLIYARIRCKRRRMQRISVKIQIEWCSLDWSVANLVLSLDQYYTLACGNGAPNRVRRSMDLTRLTWPSLPAGGWQQQHVPALHHPKTTGPVLRKEKEKQPQGGHAGPAWCDTSGLHRSLRSILEGLLLPLLIVHTASPNYDSTWFTKITNYSHYNYY